MPEKESKTTLFFAGLLTVGLTILVIISFQRAKSRTGTIVLPGGITYLGPTNKPQPTVAWQEQQGKIYPYTFSYPSSLNLGVFPGDPYDSVTVFLPNSDAQKNLFFRVENLAKDAPEYTGKSKLEYAQNWWKAYNLWTGVESVTAFTNSQGLKGYRTRYQLADKTVPYEHVFLEVPKRSDLLIWVSGALFSQEVFDKLVDSISWQKTN